MAEFKDNALTVEGLSFSIDRIKILKDISFSIKKGEFVGLIGPNGAGKTTLLKCINGIYRGDGALLIKNKPLNQISNKKVAREISLMHQNTSMTFPFPALDVVLMGRYPHLNRFKSEGAEDYKIARKYMEYTDTLQFEHKPVSSTSGGERQRVMFAKVLAQETEIILLDEPSANLDINHQEQIFQYSQKLSALGKTVIAAVHDLKIAARYCSRLILMNEGRIIAEGSPENVLTRKNLLEAFGVSAVVFKNRITGQLDFYIHQLDRKEEQNRIHVVGGGGSASGVIRQLFDMGYKVSAGVFTPGDTDLQCAEVFGIDYVVDKPFSEICEDSFKANTEIIRNADITILCNMPFGTQNIRNLEACREAKCLIIIEEDTPETRDFTGGKATEIYNELKRKAVVTTSARLHEAL